MIDPIGIYSSFFFIIIPKFSIICQWFSSGDMDSGHPVYYHTTQCPPTTQDSVCEMCNCVSIIQDTARVSYNYQFMCLYLPLWSRVEAELQVRCLSDERWTSVGSEFRDRTIRHEKVRGGEKISS